MYGKGGNKSGLNSGETSWRSYSKSLIIELKEKLADRRARTLTVLAESEDVTAFNEIDTESDGLEDTSTNLTNNESLPAKDDTLQRGQGGEVNSLSDTSSLTDSDYNDPDIRHDVPKSSPGARNGEHSHCCTRSCSEITSVSGRSYTSQDVSSRSLDDFVAEDNAADGSKERNHQCLHSVDVRCSMCLIERKIQERYPSSEVAAEKYYHVVSYKRQRARHSQKVSKYSLDSKERAGQLFGSHRQSYMKAKSDTYLCIALGSAAVHVDSHSSIAGVLIAPALDEVDNPATDRQRKTSASSLMSFPNLELDSPSKGSEKASHKVSTVSPNPVKENADSLHEYYPQVEDYNFLEDVVSDKEEEKEVAMCDKDNVEMTSDEEEEGEEKDNVEVASDVEGEGEDEKDNMEVASDKKEEKEEKGNLEVAGDEEEEGEEKGSLEVANDEKGEEEEEKENNDEEKKTVAGNYKEVAMSETGNMPVASDEQEVLNRDAEEDAEAIKEEILELIIENIEKDKGESLKKGHDEEAMSIVQTEFAEIYNGIYEEQHTDYETYEQEQQNEIEEESELNKCVDKFTFILDIDCPQEADTISGSILQSSRMATFKDDQIAPSNSFNSGESESDIRRNTDENETLTPLDFEETDHRSFSYMKTMLNELVRIFESNAEFYNAVNKTVVDRFETHYADFNMLFSAYENRSGNSGYIQMGKSASGVLDLQVEGSSSGPADAAAKLKDQNRSLQVCLEKARLANTLQTKVGHMRSMATNVAAIKAYEQTIADLEKTMMDYLQVYAKEAIGSVSDNLAKLQQSSGIHIESHPDKAEVIRSNTLHRSGTFVLKETCAAKPPNIARRRDTSVSLASASSAKPNAFVKEVEEDGDKSEESQNVPHPSPTFLVTEDKIIADTSTKMPEHSLTKSKRHDADSSGSRKKRKTQQTMKGPSCLISDQDFDNESSDSLSEAKESRNLTYTSSLLTQLLDYNSADESKTNTEESKSNKLPESTCSELIDSASENLKQQRAATFKHSIILKDNAASKKALASNVLIKSRWMSLNDDGDNFQAADKKPDLDKDGTNVDIPCENPLSENLKNVPKHIHLQERDSQVQHETRTKTTQASRKQCLADITVLSRVHDIKRTNSGAIPKVVAGSSHHEVISPNGSHPTGKNRSVNKSLMETCQDEDVTNKTTCPTEKEHVSKQPPRRSPKQYFLGQHSHKQWHQPTEDAEDVPGNRKQDMLLAKLDWSSSDDEAVDDVPRDLSPSILLRQKQKRDVDDQLEHLNQYYSRSRKSRSPLRRTATSNISRWIEDVQGSSTECMHVEAPDFFADTFPLPFRHKCQVLSGNADDDAITPENYEKHANSDNAVFVSPSQLLEARNQEENNATENLELNDKVNELAENPDSVLRATMFKDDQRETRSREEGSKRSWSVSSTSDEYILSDTRSIQVNVSRDDLVLGAPEEVKPHLENYELAQTSANKLFTYSRVETCAPKASLAVSDSSSFTVLIKQGNIIERTFKDQAAPDLSFDNQAIQTIKMVSGSIDDDCLPDEPEVADCTPLNAFPSTVKSNEDCLYHYRREVSTGHTLRESEVMSAVGANPTGNGDNHGALRNSRNNKCFKDVSQMENVSAEDGTEQTSQNQTLGKEFNKRLKNSGPAYCDAVLGETYSEETTDISTIRERWKLMENGGNVVMAIGPEGKQNSKKCTQKLPGLSADSSITIKTHSENLMSQSTGKNDVPEERATYVKTNLPDASSPYTLTDEDEHIKRQAGDLLTEYQAIDALRYKVNRLEQMLQQSDINTANFYQRNTRVHLEEPVKTSEKVTICPHCPVSASAYNSLTHRQFQPPPEHRLGSHPYCLASTDQHLLQQTQSYNVGQVFLTGHGSCVHQQRESLYVDTKLLKPSDNKSSKGCQTSGDLSLDKPQQKNEVCVDACTQSNTLEDASEECLISLEKQVANMQTDMQEIKHFTTSTSTLMMELDERTKSFAAITSTQLAACCRLLEDSQTAISAKLEHMEQNLHDQSNLSRLIKEYITGAEKNSETVMETVRAEHQVTIARTAQTVKEVISPMQESLLNQQKEFENIRSSLEEIVSMLNDKRPEPSKKGMNHESMKERIVELTSQRDAEKVFHRITRQALRALEKDHDRLRQEYVRATCRRYNTNESEAQKRLWYYLNNEDKCPHNKNLSNVRSTRRQDEVWSPRSSSADDDASSSCCMHESCPYAHVCQKECLQQQRPGYVDEDDIREFTSRKKDNSTRCKSTQIVKCAGNVGTCLARSVKGQRGGEDRHNLAVMHNDKSPKTSKVLQTSRFVEQDLELKHTRKDKNCRTPTIITGNQLDKNADASAEDIACKCSCSDKKNRTKSHS